MRHPSVLVIDDEELVGRLICDALEDVGYEVVFAQTAVEAMALLEGRRDWAGLVTDINLGRGSPPGWDVARCARHATPTIAVIYVSGDSAHDWLAQGTPLSVMISKPFSPTLVAGAMTDLLNARHDQG